LPNSLRGKLLSPIVIVGVLPSGIAVTADGSPAYVTNNFSDPDGVYTTPVVDTSSRTVTATITVGDAPWGVAINPNGEATTYVVNGGIFSQSSGSVIDNAGNNVGRLSVPLPSYPGKCRSTSSSAPTVPRSTPQTSGRTAFRLASITPWDLADVSGAPGSLAMPAAWPTTGAPHTFLKFFLSPPDAPGPSRCLLGVLDPTDELIAG
jgi:YVTN family beta-propeller protein